MYMYTILVLVYHGEVWAYPVADPGICRGGGGGSNMKIDEERGARRARANIFACYSLDSVI